MKNMQPELEDSPDEVAPTEESAELTPSDTALEVDTDALNAMFNDMSQAELLASKDIISNLLAKDTGDKKKEINLDEIDKDMA